MKQDILGFVAFAILVPFVLISTWFGISAVNHHFKSEERIVAERIQSEREAQRNAAWDCYLDKDAVRPCPKP